MPDPLADLTFRAVETSTWPDFERLFSSRGAPHYCWCQVYRATRGSARQADRSEPKSAMCERIHQGMHVGVLAYTGRRTGRLVLDRTATDVSAAEDHIRKRCGRPGRLVRVVADVFLRAAAITPARAGIAPAASGHRPRARARSQSSRGLPGGPGFAGIPVRRIPADVPGRRLQGTRSPWQATVRCAPGAIEQPGCAVTGA